MEGKPGIAAQPCWAENGVRPAIAQPDHRYPAVAFWQVPQFRHYVGKILHASLDPIFPVGGAFSGAVHVLIDAKHC